MAIRSFFLLVVLSISGLANGEIPHIDLEATSEELALLRGPNVLSTDQRFQDIVRAGQRNLDWLKEINRHRETPIALYERGQLGGIPIETPKTYSARSIRGDFNETREALPQEIKAVIFSQGPLPSALPLDVETYRTWTKKIDKSYQYATRWLLLEPYLGQLAARKKSDVRGYYHLSRIENLSEILKSYEQLESSRQEELKLWLLQLCFLSARYDEGSCLAEFEQSRSDLNQLINKFWENGRRVYQSFFDIPTRVGKSNLKFTSDNIAVMNFKLDPLKELNDFIRVNIEDGWQLGDFKIGVTFAQPAPSLIDVRWLPNVTPHVNGLGGRQITMDRNSSLDDWDTQWTIRHELGHVIGLPDCYLEFYDPVNNEIVSYQIDIEDLMCSRRGQINDRIVGQVKLHYKYGK